ncbi:hypothetical protein ACMFMG_005861 [Clarireedia jacksonii]
MPTPMPIRLCLTSSLHSQPSLPGSGASIYLSILETAVGSTKDSVAYGIATVVHEERAHLLPPSSQTHHEPGSKQISRIHGSENLTKNRNLIHNISCWLVRCPCRVDNQFHDEDRSPKII